MTTTPNLRPALTTDSLAAAMIADLRANATANPAEFFSALDEFDTLIFADMMIDESNDDDTMLIFAESRDDAALAAADDAIDSTRLHAMLTLAIDEIADQLRDHEG